MVEVSTASVKILQHVVKEQSKESKATTHWGNRIGQYWIKVKSG